MTFTRCSSNLPPGCLDHDIDVPPVLSRECDTCQQLLPLASFDDADDDDCTSCKELNDRLWRLRRALRTALQRQAAASQFPAGPAGNETAPAGGGH